MLLWLSQSRSRLWALRQAVGKPRKDRPLRSRTRTIAALSAMAGALAVPAAAGAVTLQGAGSSAEQPILLNLFSAYHKLHKNVRFTFNPDGGNAGVKLVQQHRALFAVNTRPPLPSDPR